jgi:hypothetical protein
LSYNRKQPKKLWIQNARSHIKHGALRKQLGISTTETIPTPLLTEIMATPAGGTVHDAQGHSISVTKKLRQRANFALNVR